MKKFILFLFFLPISLLYTTQNSVCPFEKAIIAFQAHNNYQKKTVNIYTKTPQPPEITPDDLLKSIQETGETCLKATLKKFYVTLLSQHDKTGFLFKLAYPEESELKDKTAEIQRLQSTIMDVFLDHVWNNTTFTSTAPSVSIALKAKEVLEKKVRKEHETFLKYFTNINKYTTRICCPINTYTPPFLKRTASHYIKIRIHQYHPEAELPDISFWS